MAESHIKGRAYNGLTGFEVKTLVLQQLSAELKTQPDPFPAGNWRRQMAERIEHELSLDNAFAMHITYPVVEWAFELEVVGEPTEGYVDFSFVLKMSAYPVHTSETTTRVEGLVYPPKAGDGTRPEVPAFEQHVQYGQEYEAPDALRRKGGIPVPGGQQGDGGRVDLTAAQTDEVVAGPRKAVESF